MKQLQTIMGRREFTRYLLTAPILANLNFPIAKAGSGELEIFWNILTNPILDRIYAQKPLQKYSDSGLLGLNIKKISLIEEQRFGADWIFRGIFCKKKEWVDFGWKCLDLGIKWQNEDGGFSPGYYHSNIMFTEALARALLIDPNANSDMKRILSLQKSLQWLSSAKNARIGIQQDSPYTHRWYLEANCFGIGSYVLGYDKKYSEIANNFCEFGLSQQQKNGRNPEMGGFDVSYQMYGVLCATRYFPFAKKNMQYAITKMAEDAANLELNYISDEGYVNYLSSSRVGIEKTNGETKKPNYTEIAQAFCQLRQIDGNEKWDDAAKKIISYSKI